MTSNTQKNVTEVSMSEKSFKRAEAVLERAKAAHAKRMEISKTMYDRAMASHTKRVGRADAILARASAAHEKRMSRALARTTKRKPKKIDPYAVWEQYKEQVIIGVLCSMVLLGKLSYEVFDPTIDYDKRFNDAREAKCEWDEPSSYDWGEPPNDYDEEPSDDSDDDGDDDSSYLQWLIDGYYDDKEKMKRASSCDWGEPPDDYDEEPSDDGDEVPSDWDDQPQVDEYGDDEMDRIIASYSNPPPPDEYGDEDFARLVEEYYDDRSSECSSIGVVGELTPRMDVTLPFQRPDPGSMLWQDGEEPVLMEKIDMKLMRMIYENFNELLAQGRLTIKQKTIDLFPKFFKAAKDCGGEFKVKYKQKDMGRFYATGRLSMGQMQKQIRGTLCEGQLDVDLVNCQPTLAYNLCVQNGIPCPLLEKFVKDREGFISSIRLIGDEQPIVKHDIHSILNGGGCKHRGLADMKREFGLISSAVFKLFPMFSKFVAHNEQNRKAKVCSRILMMIESCVQRVAMKVCQDSGYTIRVSVYDGFMVDDNPALDPDTIMRKCEGEIFKQMGYRVRFVVKPFVPINLNGFVPNPIAIYPIYQPRKRELRGYEKYNPTIHDELFVQPFYKIELDKLSFGPGIRVAGVCASMGYGKSHQVRACIRELAKVNPNFTCVDISSRKTQGAAARASMNEDGYGFVSYLDGECDVDRITIQFESLNKLSMDRTYDLVILDEIRSILDCATSAGTNRKNWDTNIVAFRHLIGGAGKIIMCDADMLVDGAVAVMLDEFFKQSEVALHVYPNTRPEFQKTIEIIPQDELVGLIRADMKSSSKKIGVVCSLKMTVDYITEVGVEEGVAVHCFHRFSDELDREKCWARPNEEFINSRVVCFNSTVTVGNDIQLEFDELYVIVESQYGCNFRQLSQMMGRFRNVKSKIIHVFLFSGDYMYLPHLTDEQLRTRDELDVKFKLDRAVERKECHISHYSLERMEDSVHWTPDWIVHLHAHNEGIKRAVFQLKFIEHQLFRGMTVVLRDKMDEGGDNRDDDGGDNRDDDGDDNRGDDGDDNRGDDDPEKKTRIKAAKKNKEKIKLAYDSIISTQCRDVCFLETEHVRARKRLNEMEAVTVDVWKTMKEFTFVNSHTNEICLPPRAIPATRKGKEIDETGGISYARNHADELHRFVNVMLNWDIRVQYSDLSPNMTHLKSVIALLRKITGSKAATMREILDEEQHLIPSEKIIAAVPEATVLATLAGLPERRVRTGDNEKCRINFVKHVLDCFCMGIAPHPRQVVNGQRKNFYTLTISHIAIWIAGKMASKEHYFAYRATC